ncbi:alkaline phosphatase D family protein [Sphingomonas bacterium]|uniref:alkaline phosphatase D family protein n=1 Tax=Sphingomonas bacterium TaxID=1895847 RepID=UPI002618F0FB|nr:alkaline phosphatase D family protein [Sphingomonas bacterium]MDB5678646.1 alkaline phosphatase [Sphingomonas bacterium]
MFRIDRRSLLMTATLGLGAYAVPGFAQTDGVAALTGFSSGVASGEPASDSMLLWTRFVPADGKPIHLIAEVSTTADFARVVAKGMAITGPWRDWTTKITVDGLTPGTRYFYRFIGPDGTASPVGRTKTLPEGPLARSFKAAIFSCSNMPFGFFNAYAHAAARDDLDLAIHLGDYFYEYKTGGYPPLKDQVRPTAPDNELIHLADYRIRYASYRSDPDLQALHARLPMIVQWDDHETANDSWEGGAENHQPDEGDWGMRKNAALQAYREWMPVSDEPWKSYEIGTLATLFRTETRDLARTEQPDVAPLFKEADPAAALKRFRDGVWMDPAATMMGTQQEDWLFHTLRRSVKAGQKWQIVGFGTIMGGTVMPAAAMGWLDPGASERTKGFILKGIEAAKVGLPFNYDNWGGYPAERARFLRAAQGSGANLVVISGDSHNGWAYDLGQDRKPAGVEFAGHSVSSPGYESAVKTDPKVVAAGLVASNPELKWCDTSRRGYMALTITPTKVSNDWLFVDSIKTRSANAVVGHTATVTRGRNVMA